MRLTHAADLDHYGAVGQRFLAQLGPIFPPSACDHVVNGSQRESLMRKMPV
jgi:hypothetical protein